MEWIRFDMKKPADGQECLTRMKHGVISGYYDAAEDWFHGYYYRDIQWFATYWVPIEDVE